jgi:hypothetical protein
MHECVLCGQNMGCTESILNNAVYSRSPTIKDETPDDLKVNEKKYVRVK